MTRSNFDLKEQVRAYWSARAATFDNSPGHRIRTPREFAAYEQLIERHAPGIVGAEVLDAASGTGEVTRLLRRLGCDVTGIDLSAKMVARAQLKHVNDNAVRFFQGDAEHLLMADARFDGVVCRNLLWTLTDPDLAFAEWFRVLRPGGTVVAFEGNWMRPDGVSRLLRRMAILLGRKVETDLPDFTEILGQLPFRDGLGPAELRPRLIAAGFKEPQFVPVKPVTLAQISRATWAERLSLLSYARGRFMMIARRPSQAQQRHTTDAA
ncbi:class I SAM-dependent methyltransferase [Pseudoruegeria sp. HB172150]|uniref:class I SAM-dependent methyltransferase n=1 Tax=Pseudoruegeria sp. HB172150 TaxID=2721164 RepID=UPI0015556264|nr:class I SAM-dependent methyltransferase [Pseudoruegeria sp. HB172150]